MEERKFSKYTPSKADRKIISGIQKDLHMAMRQRQRPFRHLDDVSLETFWRMSRDLYNGYVPKEREDAKKWKSTIFRKKTRKKVVASAAALVASGIGIDISAIKNDNRKSRELSRVTEMLVEWSAERELQEKTLLRAVLEAFTVGTAFLYEEIAWESRTVNEIDDIDLETGKVMTTKGERVDFKGPKASLVNIEELYFGDVWQEDIQQQPFIIRRFTGTYDSLKSSLSKYANWKKVVPDSTMFLSIADEDRKDMETDWDDRVEVVMYWRKHDDFMAIVANGVLLTQRDFSFPYPHKQYPFAKFTPFLFADTRFLYGDSLPHINQGDQETVNMLTRLIIDSAVLQNKPPVATNSTEIAKSDVVIPGAVVEKQMGEEVEIMGAFAQGPAQAIFNALQLEESQIDENGGDPITMGQQASGDPTATEVRAIIGSAERLKGFTEKLYAELLVSFAHLRIQNIYWFLVNDEDYQTIVIDDVKISKGRTGERHIVLKRAAELPSPAELLSEQVKLSKQGIEAELMYVNKDAVNDYRFLINVAAAPKPARNSAGKLARSFQKYQIYSANPLIDQKRNTESLVEALGDSPDEWVSQQEMAPETLDMPKQNMQLTEAANPSMSV